MCLPLIFFSETRWRFLKVLFESLHKKNHLSIFHILFYIITERKRYTQRENKSWYYILNFERALSKEFECPALSGHLLRFVINITFLARLRECDTAISWKLVRLFLQLLLRGRPRRQPFAEISEHATFRENANVELYVLTRTKVQRGNNIDFIFYQDIIIFKRENGSINLCTWRFISSLF